MGKIGQGLVSFVGVEFSDDRATVEEAARTLPILRVFEGNSGNLDRSLEDVDGDLLVIPNFTICATFSGGGRPSFDEAAAPDRAETLYEALLDELSERLEFVESGRFGAMMDVEVDNEGPVTLSLSV